MTQATDHTPEESPVTPAAVMARGKTLKTGMMWAIVGAVALGLVFTLTINPKTGAYYFGLLIALVGTLRWLLPGAPFGIAAREKWFDVLFCYGLSGAVFFLASYSYALKCDEGLFC
ncbi:DUF3017 domain-containing protein [Timonella sp. A28]|uniref:DUF3017 domain-containing protein n=1 Tax=Timonella sp. A28 TaxID=3442640 RepID=UPI003EBA66CB